MASDVLFDTQAMEKIAIGVHTLAKAVTTTLGPRGRNVAIARADGQGNIWSRTVLHDGVSVARAIDPEDQFENLGASILREAAQKQVDAVGDGTTVAILLADAILHECLKSISAGVNPMELRSGLERGAQKLVSAIRSEAIPVETFEQKRSIATISAEDKELGLLITETIEKMGEDGIVTVEESKSTDTFVDYQEGMQFEKGFVSPYFLTDPTTMSATLEHPSVLVTDLPITNFIAFVPFLQKFVQKSRSLFIIAPEFGGDALPSLIQNKMEGKLMVLCVGAPLMGTYQTSFLQDIATLTGATFIGGATGRTIDSLKVEDLGSCERVVSTREATTIVGGSGSREALAERVLSIKTQIKTEEREFDKLKLQERLGKLTSGVAIINVGGETQIEMRERKERVIDATLAVKAAMREGIVAGGETVYLRVRYVLGASRADNILFLALEQPFTILVEHAGFSGGQLLERLPKNGEGRMGFDVTDGSMKDMVESGIIDPALVSITAIQTAVSVAIQLMTIGAAIVPKKEAHAVSRVQ